MTHPSKEFFLQWYHQTPRASIEWLELHFKEAALHPEYALLSSYMARTVASYYGNEDHISMALYWADVALQCLNDKHRSKEIYGSDLDYMASLQSCAVLQVRWLSLSDEILHWHKAKTIAKDMLSTAFPAIYVKDRNVRDGVSLGLMLIGIYNRLGAHTNARDLSTRIQQQAKEHQDIPTECRASFNWAISTLFLSKEQAVENKQELSLQTLSSAIAVLKALHANSEWSKMLGSFSTVVYEYAMFLEKRMLGLEVPQAQRIIKNWSLNDQLGALDLIQMHSCYNDEILSKAILQNTNIDDTPT